MNKFIFNKISMDRDHRKLYSHLANSDEFAIFDINDQQTNSKLGEDALDADAGDVAYLINEKGQISAEWEITKIQPDIENPTDNNKVETVFFAKMTRRLQRPISYQLFMSQNGYSTEKHFKSDGSLKRGTNVIKLIKKAS